MNFKEVSLNRKKAEPQGGTEDHWGRPQGKALDARGRAITAPKN